jgi:glutamine synthetase
MGDQNDESLLQDFLDNHPTVKFIRLQWVDYSGVQHAQLAPIRTCKQLASGAISPFTVAQICMITPISIAPQSCPEKPEAWELRVDWTSLLVCGFLQTHAAVMCSTYQRDAVDPWANCPRRLLQYVVESFQEEHSTFTLVGFEVEFTLLDATLNPPANALDPVLGSSTMLGLRGRILEILQQMVEAIEMAGIQVYKFHTEGIDHFEIALSPKGVMAAVDALAHTHETIRAVAVRNGLKATFAVRPTFLGASNAHNGSHVHLSLNPGPDVSAFLAGILLKIPTLCAIGMANHDSYIRIGSDGTGEWIGYGTENRDLPIRLISDNHWEIRCADATTNMYLFLASVLSAGSDGISRSEPLVWKDLKLFPFNMSEEALAEYGILKRLPASLKAAVDLLREDDDAKRWMGGEMYGQFLKVKEIEVKNWSQIPE